MNKLKDMYSSEPLFRAVIDITSGMLIFGTMLCIIEKILLWG